MTTVELDLDGTGSLAIVEPVQPTERVVLERTLPVETAGTHFVPGRVTSQCDGDPSVEHARVQNLARVRVVAS